MAIKYSLIPMGFSLDKWSEALLSVPEKDVYDFALIIGVDFSTLRNWRNRAYRKEKFPFPAMSNFLNTCNWLDLDPREFFVLLESEG